jgi:hypothetical protein
MSVFSLCVLCIAWEHLLFLVSSDGCDLQFKYQYVG